MADTPYFQGNPFPISMVFDKRADFYDPAYGKYLSKLPGLPLNVRAFPAGGRFFAFRRWFRVFCGRPGFGIGLQDPRRGRRNRKKTKKNGKLALWGEVVTAAPLWTFRKYCSIDYMGVS